MRKILFVIGALLVSLAMQATVQTQDISLSGFSMYTYKVEEQDVPKGIFNAETLEFSKLIAWGGGQIWYGEDNASALDAGDYAYIGMDLATAAANDVRLSLEYTTADTHSAQELIIKAGKTSHLLKLNGRYIKKIEIVNASETANASFTLSKVYFFNAIGKETETHIHTTNYDLVNWDFDSRLRLSNTLFYAIHEGDKIVITYTSEANDSEHGNYVGAQVRISNGDNTEFTDVVESEMIQESQTNKEYEIVLREADIEPLKTNGMYINGKKIVINKVDLYTYAQQIMLERVLNTGSETINWNQHWKHTDLPTLAAGDELHFTVSAVDGSNNYQLRFRHDDQADGDISFAGITTTVPYVYSHTLSADEATAINTAGKLWLIGTGITVSHLAVAQPMSIYDENLLWYGEEAAGDEWSRPVSLPASKFSGVEVGDILHVLLTELDAAGQLSLTQGNYAEFSVKPSFNLNSTCAAPMALSFVINQSMKDELQANGLFVSGKKFTVAAVYVIKAAAQRESYFLKVSDAGMATLVLPFNVPDLPAGVEAYRLTSDGSEAIEATAVSAIQADKPVLIIAAANTDPGYEFVSELGADTCIFYKSTWSVGTYADGALHGNYVKEFSIPNKYEIESVMNYFYVLQNGASRVGFYQIQYWGDVKVNPYRAFLGCTNDLNGFDTPSPVPGRKMRIIFHKDAPTGVESVQQSEISSQKVLMNGQILIIRDNKTYNVLGQQL